MAVTRRRLVFALLLLAGAAVWRLWQAPVDPSQIALSSSCAQVGRATVSSSSRRIGLEASRKPGEASTALADDLAAAVARWIEERSDYQAGVKLIVELAPPDEFDRVAVDVVARLLARNPTWARNLALALPPGPAQWQSVELVAGDWARRAPKEALQWASALDEGAARHAAIERVTTEMARTGWPQAAAALRAQPPGLAQDDALCSLAAQWSRRDVPGVLEWIRTYPDDLVRPRLIGSLGFEIAQRDESNALRLARLKLAPADWSLLAASVRIAREAPAISPANPDAR